MANLVKILGDGNNGWNLTTKQAEQLHAAGKIAAPTIVALKNHFLNEVLIPKLQEVATEKGLTNKALSREISNLRDGIPEIIVNGNKHDLINLNKLWTQIKKNAGKPLKNASSYLRDDYRTRAGKGFDKNSLRLANFYDDIDNLRAIRDRDLAGTFDNDQVYDKFNQDMEALFHKNRRWLPKVDNRPIKYNPSEEWKYGWKPGKNRQGFLDSQTSVYDLSTDQARWLANKLGIKQDAGHIVPLGGMIISDAERQRFFIDKSELEPNPDGEGWLLRGTNALTNLAIEDAKGNRAKGNLSGRQLEEIIAMNTAFTKSRSLLEYNLGDDTSFRKLTDFSAAIQGLFGHGDRDINELQAIAENQLLQTGVQITPTLSKSKLPSQKGLVPNYIPTEGSDVVAYQRRGDNILNVRINDQPIPENHLFKSTTHNRLSLSNTLSNPKITNALSIGPDFFPKLHGITKAIGTRLGGPYAKISGADTLINTAVKEELKTSDFTSVVEQPLNLLGATHFNKPDLGTNLKNVSKVVESGQKGDIVGVISAGSGLFTQVTQEKIDEENLLPDR
tara:strand:- start:342 stop:2021 length:1680 start_codon:yes stop_codon:yes gene_type:complete